MYHPHEPIMSSRKKMHRNYKITHQYYFKAGDAEIRKNKEYYNFLHIYCNTDYSRYISDRRLVTSTFHLLNGTLIDWFSKKQYEIPKISSNTETRTMYKGVLDQNWIIDFFRSIGYPIGPPSNIYEDNQATIKRAPEDIIATQAIPLDVLITALHKLHLIKTVDMVDTKSNMELADLNYNLHDG